MAEKNPDKSTMYQAFFQSSEIAAIIAGSDGAILHANRQFLKLSKYSRAEIRKKTWPELIVGGDPGKTKQYQEFIDRNGPDTASSSNFQLALRDGTVRDVLIIRNRLKLNGYAAVSFIDITKYVKAGKRISISEEKYRSVIESTDDSVYMVDRDCRYLFVNRQVLSRLGIDEPDIIGRRYADFHNANDNFDFAGYVEKVFDRKASLSYEHKTDSGKRCTLRTLSPILDPQTGEIKCVAVISKDISELKKTEEKLKYLSLHDPLTNLYNRAYFEEEMHRLDNSRFELVGLIMCDIDGLKLINDTLGHEKGDELLMKASQIIKRSFRENDVVTRVGGDEFAVLLPNTPRSKVEEICSRIKNIIADYNKKNRNLPLGISIGFSTRSGPGQSMAELYREADNSMYSEKLFGSQKFRGVIVKNLLSTIEDIGITTRNSSRRLRKLVTVLGGAVGLPEKKMKDLVLLAQFHDIGNIGVHHRTLLKEEALTPDELLEVRKHCDIGHRIAQSSASLTHIAEYILKHHEWWNGGGYPLGISGDDIPLESRIIAIADAYEAMTGGRPHRKAISKKKALQELKDCAGTQFDPELVSTFIPIIS
jgi:diguanylate cyclase (GGDEF)-like protein/PAS domain S-box-containing protein